MARSALNLYFIITLFYILLAHGHGIYCLSSVYMYSPLNLFGHWTLNKHYYYYPVFACRYLNRVIAPHYFIVLYNIILGFIF